MSSTPVPTLFLSHGSPVLPGENVPAREFLKDLGTRYRQNVKTILCISAHWETLRHTVNSIVNPGAIQDFYGYSADICDNRYPAHGSYDAARQVADLVSAAGIPCDIDQQRGLDHGAWVPLQLMFPYAEVPVIQLSIQRNLDPAHHIALGEALSSLRDEGVLVIGSGGAIHPFGYSRAWLEDGAPTEPWAQEFQDWLTDAVTEGNREHVVKFRTHAPHHERAHPRPDHLMPLLVAWGAAGQGSRGQILHHSWYRGNQGLAAFEFR
jgi:4,5-DOPA dioxygenase extradiol